MNMFKQGFQMSMQFIVITAALLLLLFVIVYLIGNTASGVKDGTSCTTAGGRCQADSCEFGVIADVECSASAPNCCRLVPV